jgi:subtilisin family serine protease
MVTLAVLLAFSLIAPPDLLARSTPHPVDEAPGTLGSSQSKRPGAPNSPSGPVRVMIELTDEPGVVAGARAGSPSRLSTSAVQAQASRNDQAQQSLLRALQSGGINARVTYRVQKAYNGIASVVDAATIPRIQGLPGVKAVHLITPKKMSNAVTVPLIGAPAAWTAGAPPHLLGDNVRIGIIDSGIDYLHTNFGGPGTSPANDVTKIGDTPGFFPDGPAVKGGTDLVGDSYNADDPNSTPQPDPDPNDCNGHGSHVAGTAAGRGVNLDGSTFTGPYDGSVGFGSIKIGPGVAPRASLYAIKVFGCIDSSDVVTQAIEWALDPNGDTNISDHLDVINMSLGADFGNIDDPDVAASNNAALSGMVVVTAAGNGGDVTGIAGTPASATRAIAAAASDDSTTVTDGFLVTASAGSNGAYPASASALFDWQAMTGQVTGDLYYPSTNLSGCAPFTGPDAFTIINFHPVLLLDWVPDGEDGAPCGSIDRVTNAKNAGAKGVILAYNQNNLDITINGAAGIPSVITPSDIGDTLKSALGSSSVEVAFDKALLNTGILVDSSFENQLASFSSRGPGTRAGNLKPDLTAPGVTVFSTKNGSGTEGVSFNGTSMASPHVAGMMALLKQQHPDWTVEELKALAINTADVDVFADDGVSPVPVETTRGGAGRIDVATAIQSELVAYETDEPGQVSVSFGPVQAFGPTTLDRTIQVANKGGSAASFTVNYQPLSEVRGVSISFPDGTSFNVGAGGTTTFKVRLSLDPSLMKNTRPPTMAATQVGEPRQYLAEVTGLVDITPTPGEHLRVPVYAAVRPASDMHANLSTLAATAPTQTFPVGLTGTSVDTGTTPFTDIRSQVSAFELQATSPAQPAGADPADKAGDLRYVGVSSDGRVHNAVIGSKLYFGVALEQNWLRPSEEVGISVFIDTNRDGTDDYELFNTEFVDGSGDFTDVMVSALYNISADSTTLGGYLNVFDATRPTAIFDNNVLLMAVPVSSLSGLSTTNSRFNYRVNVYYAGALRDSSGPLTYDWLKPGLDVFTGTGQTPIFLDSPSTSIPVAYNSANYQANASQGLLLLHHYNRNGQRADVLNVTQPQTVSFAPGSPTAKGLGDPPFPVSATATSGLPVTITSQTPSVCTISPSQVVTLVSVGTCTLHASQAGNALFPAAQADLSITVSATACAPRPNITVTTARESTGHLRVTVTAGNGTLQTIQFGTNGRPLQNATVQITGANGPQQFTAATTVTIAAGTSTLNFNASQTTPGQAMTVPMIVTDGCGAWETFVGVGAGG